MPITRNGAIGFQVENVMASVAAAWGCGISWDAIRAGLKTFVGESDNAPGRFNVFDYRGATVIADYGHNPDAISALVHAVESMPGLRRSVVISGAGDRRDEDIRQQTQILGAAFDDVMLYQDQCQRGRADGEVIALLRDGLQGATRTSHVEEIQGEFVAIDEGLIPLGGRVLVAGTPFDFRGGRPIGERIAMPDKQLRNGAGYDHNFVLTRPAPDGLALAARLEDPVSGRVLELHTREPGLQVYSGNFLDGSAGFDYRSGVCLEPQHFPDSPNQPSFPSTILHPGAAYTTESRWRFSA